MAPPALAPGGAVASLRPSSPAWQRRARLRIRDGGESGHTLVGEAPGRDPGEARREDQPADGSGPRPAEFGRVGFHLDEASGPPSICAAAVAGASGAIGLAGRPCAPGAPAPGA